jgi:hypothetical protein
MTRVVVLTRSNLQHRFVAAALAELPGIVGIVETAQPSVPFWKRVRRAYKRFGFAGMVSRGALKLALKLSGEAARRETDLRKVLDEPRPVGGVPVFKTVGVNSAETQKVLRNLNPDILCVYGTYIVSDATLSIARQLALNLHTGMSPRYRGADCEFWPIHNKEPNYVGATVHRCTSDLDGGAIYGVVPASLHADDRLGAVFGRSVVVGSALYRRIVDDFIEGRAIQPVSQDLAMGKEYKVAMRGWRAELRVASLIRSGLIRDYVEAQERGRAKRDQSFIA